MSLRKEIETIVCGAVMRSRSSKNTAWDVWNIERDVDRIMNAIGEHIHAEKQKAAAQEDEGRDRERALPLQKNFGGRKPVRES